MKVYVIIVFDNSEDRVKWEKPFEIYFVLTENLSYFAQRSQKLPELGLCSMIFVDTVSTWYILFVMVMGGHIQKYF